MAHQHLFTSEAVCIGHPDKLSDQISDAVLDEMLRQDPMSRVACETLVTTGIVVVSGEITTRGYVEIPEVVRQVVREVGYDGSEKGFDYKTCGVLTMIDKQSADIAAAVKRKGRPLGAGDQGIMFGFACDETDVYMPLPIHLAQAICRTLRRVRESGALPFVWPDGKSMVTVEYDDGVPRRVHTVVCSTQHSPKVSNATLRREVIARVIKPSIPARLLDRDTIFYVNPSGRFVVGGPQGDCGMTGRKIIADTFGGMGHHGGGAFSGKDPTKVDRTATYAARHAAKNVVAAGLARRCEIQISYAIGVAEPISIHVDTYGTGEISDERISALIRDHFDFTPAGMIDYYRLRRPIYKETARDGHFGVERPTAPWERLEKVAALKKGR
jgi:S-adenosylmethionine synthetase